MKIAGVLIICVILTASTVSSMATELNSNQEAPEEETSSLRQGGMIQGYVYAYNEENPVGKKWEGINGVTVHIMGIGLPNIHYKSFFVDDEQETYTYVSEVEEKTYDGRFSFGYVPGFPLRLPKPGFYILTFEKEGFSQKFKLVTLSMNQDSYGSLNIKLIREA